MKKKNFIPLIYLVSPASLSSLKSVTPQPAPSNQSPMNHYCLCNPILPEILKRPKFEPETSNSLTESARKNDYSPLPNLTRSSKDKLTSDKKSLLVLRQNNYQSKSPIQWNDQTTQSIKMNTSTKRKIEISYRKEKKNMAIKSDIKKPTPNIKRKMLESLLKKIILMNKAKVIDQPKKIKEEKIQHQKVLEEYYNQIPLTESIDVVKLDQKNKFEDQKKVFGLENYQFEDVLGQGSYAVVKMAVDMRTNQKVAIKIYEKKRINNPSKVECVKNEIEILKKCDHPNIVKIQKVIETDLLVLLKQNYLFTIQINIVMSLGGSISLKQLMKKKKLNTNEIKYIFLGLMKAVQYLHQNKVVHRDIKLENILLDENNLVKLIDFGFAVSLSDGTYLTQSCGTPPYMSPELLPPYPQYREEADIWSCGVVLYLMVKETFPFRGNNEKELFYRIKTSQLIKDIDINSEIWELIKGCLERDVKKRKKAFELVKILTT